MVSGTWSRSTPPGAEEPGPAAGGAGPAAVAWPDPLRLAALLDEYAPLGPAPLVPEVLVFQGRGVLEIWSAAERLAGTTLGPPFWAYPWPGGIALARLVLDRPELVAGARVLDLGTGGGVAALAAARAGAAAVTANDQDPWALTTARLAAERQGLELTMLLAELTAQLTAETGEPGEPGELGEPSESVRRYDVVLCADLAYERRVAPRIRAFLEAARAGGARVLLADAGRAYFDDTGCTLQAEYTVPVPRDLEGADTRTARVFLLP